MSLLREYWDSAQSFSFRDFCQQLTNKLNLIPKKENNHKLSIENNDYNNSFLDTVDKNIKSYFCDSVNNIWNDLYEYVYYIIDEVCQNTNKYVIVPITRKGYWLFKVVSNSIDKPDNIILKTDRYINKSLDYSFLENKTIILIDDTLTHGDYLFDFYMHLKQKVNSAKLIPYVFYLNNDYKIGAAEDRKDFNNNLRYFEQKNSDTLSEFCIYEMALFHELHIPYTIDIPIFNRHNNSIGFNSFLNNTIIIKQKKLNKLLSTNFMWQYEDYSYSIRDIDVKSGFFSLQNTYLYSECSWLLQNFVIKLRYKYISDNNVVVSFTPFVLMRSIDIRDLLNLFIILYREDGFKNKNYMYMTKLLCAFDGRINLSNVPSNLYIALYRAIVYRLSLYTWLLFDKSILKSNNIDVEWQLNDEIMKDNCDEVFIKDNQHFYKSQSQKSYQTILVDLYNKLNITLYNSGNIKKEPSVQDTNKVSKKVFDYKESIASLHLNWLDYKRKNTRNDTETNDHIGILNKGSNYSIKVEKEIEDVEAYLDRNFKFDVPFQKKVQTSKMILHMLDMSIISNQIDYDKPIVKRGFKFGENSDLFFFFNVQYVYAGIRGFVEKILHITKQIMRNSEKVYDMVSQLYEYNFDDAMTYILRYVNEMGLMNVVMSSFDYDCSYHYFKNISKEVKLQIENKSYLYDESNILHKSIHDYAFSRDYKVEKAWLE